MIISYFWRKYLVVYHRNISVKNKNMKEYISMLIVLLFSSVGISQKVKNEHFSCDYEYNFIEIDKKFSNKEHIFKYVKSTRQYLIAAVYMSKSKRERESFYNNSFDTYPNKSDNDNIIEGFLSGNKIKVIGSKERGSVFMACIMSHSKVFLLTFIDQSKSPNFDSVFVGSIKSFRVLSGVNYDATIFLEDNEQTRLIYEKNNQGIIYNGTKSYPSSRTFPFKLKSPINSSSYFSNKDEYLSVSFGKKDFNKGVILIKYKDYESYTYGSKIFLKGDILLYLSNTKVIKCIDRGIHGYSDNSSSAMYFLTSAEIEMLKKYSVVSISFSTSDEYGFANDSHTAYNKDATITAIQALFQN